MDFSKYTYAYLFFFLWALSDSWPLSSSLSSDWLLVLLLEELLDESLDESLAIPVSSFTSIVSANAANSGSLSLSTFNHFRDNFGLPRTCLQFERLTACYTIFRAITRKMSRACVHIYFFFVWRILTVLCQTTGKLVREQKFCVTAIVSSRFKTMCHQPPGMKTVSPGVCKISIGRQSCGHVGNFVRG